MSKGSKNSMLENFDLNSIQDIEGARQAIIQLLNLVEELAGENRKLREENQQLRDEINRLKGEQGKPKVKASKRPSSTARTNYSSERERCKPKKRKKASKVSQVKIDREEVVRVDEAALPADAEFKGYEEVVVQDIKIETDNVLFRKEKFHSPTEHKSYLAELPAGYEGQFGPGIKALAIVLYYGVNTSEPKVKEFFEHVGILISAGQVSNLLIKKQDQFHAEKERMYIAGLGSSSWQHIDDTGIRVNGVNEHTQTVCNPLYTVYVTTEKKNRLAVLEALLNGHELTFCLNATAYAWLDQVSVPVSAVTELRQFPQDQALNREMFTALVDECLPTLGAQHRRYILEAAAIAAYRTQQEFPIIELPICDDAPQFKRLTDELALCWVHDGRHYKKLNPVVAHHRQLLDDFLNRYWDYYDDLLTYKLNPTLKAATRLSQAFDDLFSETTGYVALDKRIAKTKAKKEALLMALKHPEIPLHNNPAELQVRRRARKRDVSFGPRTADGKKAWDTFLSLAATTKKLDVSFYKYVHDRVSNDNKIPQLADLIAQQAELRRLNASWESV
jgi:regulator of replication initiation timing